MHRAIIIARCQYDMYTFFRYTVDNLTRRIGGYVKGGILKLSQHFLNYVGGAL